MGPVGTVGAYALRRSLGAVLLIAAICGVAGGLATGLGSAATRTSTSMTRLLAQTRLPDILAVVPTATDDQVEQIRHIEGVTGVAAMRVVAVYHDGEYFPVLASADDRYGVDIDVPHLIAGRRASPDAPDEVVITESLATALHVGVGDQLSFSSHTPQQVAAWGDRQISDAEFNVFLGPKLHLDVVGIERHPSDLTSDDPIGYFLALTPAFLHTYGDRVDASGSMVLIDFGPWPSAAQQAAVQSKVRAILGDSAGFIAGGAQAGVPLMSTMSFVARSMLALAAAVGFAALVVGALLMSRMMNRAAAETASLSAIGMTARERGRALTSMAVVAAVSAAVIAVVVAAVTSDVLPFGLARRVEPQPGLHPDVLILFGGVVATLMLVAALGTVYAAGAVRSAAAASGRPSALVNAVAKTGLPPATLVGVDLAAGRSQAARGKVNRVAVAAVALATTSGVAALVLSSSITQLRASPKAFGRVWDVEVHGDDQQALADRMAADPEVAASGFTSTGAMSLNGRPVVMRGLESAKGPLPVLIVAGRAPQAGEIALGRRTLRDLHVRIGDVVHVQGANGERDMRIVGEAVLAGVIDVPEAGSGGVMPLTEFNELGVDDSTGAAAMFTLVAGVDPAAFAGRLGQAQVTTAAAAPVELQRLREIERFPWILGGFLIAVGLLAAVHALFTTLRRRRRDLAVLRTMGLGGRGVRSAVTLYTVLLAVAGALVGIPLGVVGGRLVWRALAHSLGVVAIEAVPWATIAITAGVAAAAFAALALTTSRRTAATSIAVDLRTE